MIDDEGTNQSTYESIISVLRYCIRVLLTNLGTQTG